jgi:hypothetical protein
MMAAIATQVLSFDNFGSLEAHLQALLDRYSETAGKYRETLGEIMRSNQAGDEKWSQEMSAAVSGAEKPKQQQQKKTAMPKMMLSKKKKDGPAPEQGWVLFDPFSVFVGQGASGQAELYFDAINQLDDTAKKLKLAIDVLDTLRARVAAPGSVSMIVSFVNDVPSRIMLKPAAAGGRKKSWAFSFSVAPARPALVAAALLQA